MTYKYIIYNNYIYINEGECDKRKTPMCTFRDI